MNYNKTIGLLFLLRTTNKDLNALFFQRGKKKNDRCVCSTIHHIKYTDHWNLHWPELVSVGALDRKFVN